MHLVFSQGYFDLNSIFTPMSPEKSFISRSDLLLLINVKRQHYSFRVVLKNCLIFVKLWINVNYLKLFESLLCGLLTFQIITVWKICPVNLSVFKSLLTFHVKSIDVKKGMCVRINGLL